MPAGSYVKRMPWGQQKPLLGYGIDWSHPLANGIVGCWLFNEGAGGIANDIVKNYRAYAVGASWSEQGIRTSRTPHTYYICNEFVWPNNEITILSAYIGGNKYEADSILSRYSTNDRTILVQQPYNEDNFALYAPGAYRVRSGLVPSKNNVYAIVLSTSGNYLRIHLNNMQYSTTSRTIYGTNGIVFGGIFINSTDQGQGLNGVTRYAMIYNCALSAAEVAALYDEPYCFIEGWNYGRDYSIPSGIVYRGSLVGDSALVGNGVLIGGGLIS